MTERPFYSFFFPMLGPLCLCTTFLIANHFYFSFDLLLFYFLAAFLLYKERKRGFYYSAVFLGCLVLVRQILSPSHFWELGLDLSLFLGLFATYEGISYAERFYLSLKEKAQQAEKELKNICDRMRKQDETVLSEKEKQQLQTVATQEKIKELQEKNHSLEKLCFAMQSSYDLQDSKEDSLQAEIWDQALYLQQEQEKVTFLEEKLNTLYHPKKLEGEKKEYLHKLNHQTVAHFQANQVKDLYQQLYKEEKEKVQNIQKLLSVKEMQQQELEKRAEEYKKEISFLSNSLESLQKQLEEKKKRSQDLISLSHVKKEKEQLEKKYHEQKDLMQSYNKKIKTLHQIKSSYEQLQKQFKEKNILLHETRKKLFSLQTKAEVDLMQQKEEQLSERDLLFEDFSEENELLIDLVSHLLKQE